MRRDRFWLINKYNWRFSSAGKSRVKKQLDQRLEQKYKRF